MIFKIINNIKCSKADIKKFGYLFSSIFMCLSIVLWWKHYECVLYLFIASAVMFILSVLKYEMLIPIYKVWMAMSLVLGWIMTRIILSLMYFIGFMLVSIIGRMFGKTFLDQKIDRDAESYWISKIKPQGIEYYENQY